MDKRKKKRPKKSKSKILHTVLRVWSHHRLVSMKTNSGTTLRPVPASFKSHSLKVLLVFCELKFHLKWQEKLLHWKKGPLGKAGEIISVLDSLGALGTIYIKGSGRQNDLSGWIIQANLTEKSFDRSR